MSLFRNTIRLAFACMYISFAVLIIIGNKISNKKIEIADGFIIKKYNVILDVKENNTIDVTENITVNFRELKHGILKKTPLWLEYTGKDGKTIKRKSKVLNYRAVGENYSLDTVNKKARIKIGDADKYVGIGDKTYVIKYTYDMGRDPFKNFDEFIFHTYGDYWGTEIKNASLQVIMPKSIEGYTVNFFKDKYRQTNVNEVVDYSVIGNTLNASFNAEKDYEKQLNKYCNQSSNQNEDGTCNKSNFKYNSLKSALTVDIELPDGYFVGGSWNYGFGSFLISIIAFALTGVTIYKWFKFGKDHDKGIKTVEFYPPDNLNAAQIGYIYNKRQINKKLTIALIIQLASKGYLKIDDLKDKEKNIKITNLAIIKPNEIKKVYEEGLLVVKKLKDADDNLTRFETTVMVHLFKKSNYKVIDNNIDNFLKAKDKLVNEGYIEILDINKIPKLPDISGMEKIVYNRLFEKEDEFILSENKRLYLAFTEIENTLKYSYKDKIHDKQSSKQIKWALIRSIIILILSIVSYVYVEDLDPNFSIFYILPFGCIFINLIFIMFMNRKTEYGELISAKVKGFREFLITAEKEKLEALVNENPNYFYDILPYTYVLNISKKWIKKFENIPIPEIDMGTFNYGSDSSYHSLYSDVYHPVSSSSSGSSSGCSSCGGGCSSCGGGCSSCGGGGSW